MSKKPDIDYGGGLPIAEKTPAPKGEPVDGFGALHARLDKEAKEKAAKAAKAAKSALTETAEPEAQS